MAEKDIFKQLCKEITSTKTMNGKQAKVIAKFVKHINSLVKFDEKFTSKLDGDDCAKYSVLLQYMKTVRREIKYLNLTGKKEKEIVDVYDLFVKNLESSDMSIDFLLPIIVNLNIKYIEDLMPAFENCC